MIHATASIDKNAIIEDGVEIGPFCSISAGVHIHSGCVLHANVILDGNITLEENVKIFSFANLGNGSNTITVGKETVIREFCIIATDSQVNYPVVIAENNFVMAYVNLKAGVHLDAHCILTNAVTLSENVHCGEKVIIGGLSTIEKDNTIGTGVMIGGASYITHDMPPFCLVEGHPAVVKGLNLIGLRRRLPNTDAINEIRSVYKEIFRTDNVDKESAQQIASEHQNSYVRQLASFVANSNM